MTKQGPIVGAELDEFLAGGLVCRLSCVDDQGWPYVVPVWFDWEGDEFCIVAKKHALWVSWIEADPRVALCIDVTGPNRRVICQGLARVVESPGTVNLLHDVGRRMGERYMGGQLKQYVASIAAREHCLIAVKPKRLVTWQGPSRD